MNKRKLIAIAIVVVSIAAAAAGYILLPDTLVTQISLSGGAGSTAPKELGLLIPFGVSGLSAAYYSKEGKTSHLVAAIIGLLVYIPVFAFNL